MAMIGMSPWAAAAGGLAGGLGQGIMTGMDVAQRRRQEEAQKQRDAMQLLITGFKHLSDDPESLKQFTQWFGQTTGMPVPPWVGGTGGGVAGKLAQQRDQMKAAGFSDAQINSYLFSMKEPKPEPQHYMWTPKGPVPVAPGKYHGIPQSLMPGWTFGPNMEEVPLKPGYKPPPAFLTQQAPQVSETTGESPTSPAEMKGFDVLQEQLNAAQSPEEVKVLKERIRKGGGEVVEIKQPGWFTDTTKYMVVPPTTKKKTTTTTKTKGGLPPAFIDTNRFDIEQE